MSRCLAGLQAVTDHPCLSLHLLTFQSFSRILSIPCAYMGPAASPRLNERGESLVFLGEEWDGVRPSTK